jgi:hypothetical protein
MVPWAGAQKLHWQPKSDPSSELELPPGIDGRERRGAVQARIWPLVTLDQRSAKVANPDVRGLKSFERPRWGTKNSVNSAD